MITNRFRLKLVLFASLFTLSHKAFGIGASLLGGFNWSKQTNAATGTTNSPKAGITYGALGQIGIAPFFDLESGILSNNIRYNQVVSGGNSTSLSYSTIEIPVVLRFEPVKFISVGAGLYYERFSNVTRTTNSSVTSAPWSDSNYGNRALGFKLNARISGSLVLKLRWLLDASIKRGITDRANSPTVSDRDNAFTLLGGIGIFI